MFKKRLLSALLVAAVLISGIGIAFWALRPPTAPSVNDPDYIPYNQMLTDIKAMTGQPHPSGTKELADVRDYLLSQLNEMGVDYEVLSTTYPATQADMKQIDPSGKTQQYEPLVDQNGNITLYDILVKLDAPDANRGVLFMAHYDSVFNAPGACDDMTGVCAWLEALRRQSNNKNLKNDLYFLFTDGEEPGTLGAESFVRDHSDYAAFIDLVVNLDARGTSGGLLMFETSAHDYEQVQYFQAASSHPISYSWLPMIYRQMPNGTDLTEFLNAGYHGLNFAVAEGIENIEASNDDIDHLDRRTAYNFLQTAFDMSDYAANNALTWSGDNQDGIYFTLLPGVLVLFSDVVARILAGIAVLTAIAWLIWQLRRGHIRLRGMLSVAGWQLGSIAAAGLLTQGIAMLLNTAGLFRWPGAEFSIPVFVCVMVTIGVGAFTVFALLTRRRTFSEKIAGSLLLMIPLTALTAVFFNATSYLFAFPALGLVILGLLAQKRTARTVVSAIVGIAVLLLYVPVSWVLYIALGYKGLPVTVAAAAIPITLIAAFFTGRKTSQTDENNEVKTESNPLDGQKATKQSL